MSKIFISYRRRDSAGFAGRICDHVSERFGNDAVFRDVETLEGGVDFVDAINTAIGSCGAFILVIGPSWLNAKDTAGRRRLDVAGDPVRMELVSAFSRKIRVIPLLVDGATMPGEDDLPADLRSLARRHAVEITDSRFETDMGEVIRALESALGRPTIMVDPVAAEQLRRPPPTTPQRPPSPPVTVQPPRPPVVATAVPNYLIWSIVSTACLCLPLGIVAIVQSNKAAAATAAGDVATAQTFAASARKWNLLSLGLGFLGWLIVLAAGAMNAQQ